MTGVTGSPAPEDQPEEQTPPPPPMAPPSTAVEDLGVIAPVPGDATMISEVSRNSGDITSSSLRGCRR